MVSGPPFGRALLLYTSALDATRTVLHELAHVEEQGRFRLAVTTTGLEMLIDRTGEVRLIAGGHERRLVPPEAWELRSHHLYRPQIVCGRGGVLL